ncbi:alpha/beta hydrolase [Klenkia sp. PcliD-1-E]|uniref:alpha/beta hydrolase n=1 Tax=Klenkia sp. PcliD-1-E TaxID=2954492 RepID=UPI0020981099|nr:alpha/beta hydrolase [Klenkia sp. PcliD-1-E]MCO7220908.1 alpha/beta hydrolase [Klenkia sp. PcliD-1-E]
MRLPPPAHTAPLPPARTTESGVRVLSGVPYAALPGARPLELDLYLPQAQSPVVLFLHGGGWRLGSRHSAGPQFRGSEAFEHLARAGIAVASADYRLTGEAVWPAQLHDVKAAVRWLRSRAGELGVDGDRIAAWGESAGGHLAAMLGLTGPDLDGDLGVVGVPSTVAAVVGWYPPTDLATVGDPADPDSREAQLLGAPPLRDRFRAAEASPITHTHPDAPPFLLLHGGADSMVPHAQSAALAQLLPDVEFETLPGADHMWAGSPDAARTALERTTSFLTQHLIGDHP